jgi:hypothetical protein
MFKEITCKVCETPFIPNNRLNTLCSDKCKKISAFNARWKTTIERSRIKFPDDMDKDEYVECGVCGFRTRDLAEHPKTHGLSQLEYREKYGPIVCVSKCNRIKGDKNPAYQHGGRLSPYSKKFIKYEELPDDYVENHIQELFKTASDTKRENNNIFNTIEYHTSRGRSEEEALEIISTTCKFTLEKCISKYGEIEGKAFWEQRQINWQNTLNARTQDLIDESNRKKDSSSFDWALNKTNGDVELANELYQSRSKIKTSKVNFRSLWSKELTEDGYFYVIQFDDKIKIGITFKTKLHHRYPLHLLNTCNTIMFQKMENINHAFQTEQLLKRKYKNYIKKDDYGEFGWTEVLNDIDLDTLMEDVNGYVENPEHVYTSFDIMFKRN